MAAVNVGDIVARRRNIDEFVWLVTAISADNIATCEYVPNRRIVQLYPLLDLVSQATRAAQKSLIGRMRARAKQRRGRNGKL